MNKSERERDRQMERWREGERNGGRGREGEREIKKRGRVWEKERVAVKPLPVPELFQTSPCFLLSCPVLWLTQFLWPPFHSPLSTTPAPSSSVQTKPFV